MPTEEEKRKHRCCFSGHRPEKLNESEDEIRRWLKTQIEAALAAGYTTFITGCAMGVDIWAGQIVAGIRNEQKKQQQETEIRLIAATPWPGFANRWSQEWQKQYHELLKSADLVVNVSRHYEKDVFEKRSEWMVDHATRLIAYYNGAPGGTKSMVEYAQRNGLEIVTNNPTYHPRERKRKSVAEEEPFEVPYPENLVTAIGLERIFDEKVFKDLSDDQAAGLEHVIEILPEKERAILEYRFKNQQTFQECADFFGYSLPRAQQAVSRAVKKLRKTTNIAYIRDGFEKTELSLKLIAAEEMKKQLRRQRKRYPLMSEEDVVKFVFQGMLGVGHLISSVTDAEARLRQEMDGINEETNEPLIERISPEWVRINLRAAKKEGIKGSDIAYALCESAKMKGLTFTRQNVYNFCVKFDSSEKMRLVAEKILDENSLPSHSEGYREAYKPAYRVLYNDYRKLKGGDDS